MQAREIMLYNSSPFKKKKLISFILYLNDYDDVQHTTQLGKEFHALLFLLQKNTFTSSENYIFTVFF